MMKKRAYIELQGIDLGDGGYDSLMLKVVENFNIGILIL